MRKIEVRMDELLEKLSDAKLMENRGLGNEVGFYIFDYEPKDELVVRHAVEQMVQQKSVSASFPKIQVFDLYELILIFFEERGYMEKNFKMEEKKGSWNLFHRMQQALRLATDDDWIVRYIEEHLEKDTLVLLTGVGKAFPILRSHSLLNNLQTVIETQPLLLFYPGTYTNGQLRLFSRFLDDHYYRAFKIIED